MTNQEQYEIFKQCVESTGAKTFCFCRGYEAKVLLAKLEAAGIEPQILSKVAQTRPLVLGMRGCCLSSQKVLEEAAKILGVTTSTSNPSPSGHNRREFFLDDIHGECCLKEISTKSIGGLVKNFWSKLQTSLARHPALSVNHNPVIAKLRQGLLSATQAETALKQYSLLIVTIVMFLATAKGRLDLWDSVSKELKQNIDEELGMGLGGRTHLSIFLRLASQQLGMSINEEPNKATHQFLISTILLNLLNRSEHFVAGMVYALEASAKPELICVAVILNQFAKLAGKELSIDIAEIENPALLNRQADPATLSFAEFIGLHVVGFEIGHEARLKTALKSFVNSEAESSELEAGYELVLCAMDTWWEALACG